MPVELGQREEHDEEDCAGRKQAVGVKRWAVTNKKWLVGATREHTESKMLILVNYHIRPQMYSQEAGLCVLHALSNCALALWTAYASTCMDRFVDRLHLCFLPSFAGNRLDQRETRFTCSIFYDGFHTRGDWRKSIFVIQSCDRKTKTKIMIILYDRFLWGLSWDPRMLHNNCYCLNSAMIGEE